MDIIEEKINDAVVLRVKTHRLDANNSYELKHRITELIEEGNLNLVIEMGEVEFVDSSGLGALISGFKNARGRQGQLAISGVKPQIQSMFELTRLHRVFKIFATVEDAVDNTP